MAGNITVSVTKPVFSVDATTSNVDLTNTTTVVDVSATASIADPATVRTLLSANVLTGYGNLTYDETTGNFQLTGPTNNQIRGTLSATAPISYDDGDGIISLDNPISVAMYFDGNAEFRSDLGITNTGSLTFNKGSSTNEDVIIEVEQPFMGLNPKLKYNASTFKWQFTNDGTIFNNFVTTADLPVQGITSVNGDVGPAVTLDADDIDETATREWLTTTNFNNKMAGFTGDFGTAFGNDINVRGDVKIVGSSPFTYQTANGELTVNEFYAHRDVTLGLDSSEAGQTTRYLWIDRSVFNSGTGGNAFIKWNESDQQWKFGKLALSGSGGEEYNIPRNTDELAEGTNVDRLYFSPERANTAIVDHFANASAAPFVFNGNVDVQGNLNYVNVEDLLVNDRTITLNYGNVAQDAQIIIDRTGASGSNVDIKWNETTDKWQFTNNGSLYYDIPTSGTSNAEVKLYLEGVGLQAAANLETTGNIVGTYLHGDGSNITGIAGTITNVIAGDGLTGGGSTGAVTLDVVGGTGITANANDIALDDTAVTPGTYGDSTNVAQVTVDQQGRITSVTDVAITGGGGSYSNVDVANFLANGFGSNTITTTGDITTTGFFEGDLNGAVTLDVYNDTGATLNKGDVVYLTGGETGANPHVALADSDDATKMPAIGVVKEQITSPNVGQVVTSGEMNDSSHGYTLGADLYVDTTAGQLTTTIPTGEDKLIQKIGKVVGTNHILVQGAFRTNATPNLNEGNIFLGDTNNVQRTVTPSNNFNTLGNAFDLSNALTNINSITAESADEITLNSNTQTQFNQLFNSTSTNVGNVRGDGYAPVLSFNFRYTLDTTSQAATTTLLNGSAQNIDAYAFAGTTTVGSNQLAITDGGTFRSFNDNGSFTSDFTTAKAGIGQYCGFQDIYFSGWSEPSTGQLPGFPPDSYVTAVDTVGNTITMSKNATSAQTYTSSSPVIIPQAAVDVSTGFMIDIASENDFGISNSRTAIPYGQAPFYIVGASYRKGDAYGYPLTGPDETDFEWSLGTDSDWTYNFGNTPQNVIKYLRQRTALDVNQGALKATRGLVIGNSTEMSNRGENDAITTFGMNMMFDGAGDQITDIDGAGLALPQMLFKQYTNGTFQGVGQSQTSRGGPRMIFQSAQGSVDTNPYDAYPIVNQELGRLTFMGTTGDNITPSSINVPAFINVNAHDDWTAQGTVTGNADMHFAATSNKNNGADVFMSYEGGELVLASGKNSTSANIVLAPAQLSAGGNIVGKYGDGIHQYARVNYNNIGSETGSKLSVVQGTNGGTVGDISLSLTRDLILGTDSVSLGQSFGWLDGSDVGDPASDSIIVLASAGAFNSIETDGTQVTISGVTGPGSSNLNGGTFYVNTIATEDIGGGYNGSGSAVYLYTDSGTTTKASASTVGVVSDFGSGTGTGNGTVEWPITGTAAKEWEFELESSSTDLKIKEDGVTRVTVDSAGDITANSFIGDGSQLTGLPGGGSVTSVGSGNGLTGGPITGSGSLEIDTGVVVDLTTAQTLTGTKTIEDIAFKKYKETVVAHGNQSGDITSTLDANDGTIHTLTATGDITIDGIANAVAGTSVTIIITQDGTGDKVLSSTMKFAGGNKTLSVPGGSIDIISVFYDGSNYYASLGLGYA